MQRDTQVYVKPFQLEEKKTKESYNIINGMERPKDVVEKQFSFGGARVRKLNQKFIRCFLAESLSFFVVHVPSG